MTKADSTVAERRRSSVLQKKITGTHHKLADRRRSSIVQRNMAESNSKVTGRRKSSATQRRMSTISHHLNDRRMSSAGRRYQPSSVSQGRSARPKCSKPIYIVVVVTGLLVAIGGGFGIGVAIYPDILNSVSASIQDAAGVNPIDVQSDDDEEIVIPVATTQSSTARINVGIDHATCGRSALTTAVIARMQRMAGLERDDEELQRRKRIVNGVIGSLEYYPWQVSLWSDGSHTCGGSIISSKWILTAAHCLYPNDDPKNWTIHAGANLLDEMMRGQSQEMELSDLVIHSGFSTETFDNDVALMRMTNHLQLGEMVSPVCLPTSDEELEAGKRCFISGWGAKEEGGYAEPVLMNATVEIIDGFVCNGDDWLQGMVLTNTMICAGKESGEVDACQGDSGGPLSCQRDDERFVVSGIVSWGIGCGTERMPGVYARTSWYRSWIMDSIQTVELKYR